MRWPLKQTGFNINMHVRVINWHLLKVKIKDKKATELRKIYSIGTVSCNLITEELKDTVCCFFTWGGLV